MTAPTRLVDALADHVERFGTRPDARRAAMRWVSLDPTLRPFPSPAVLAATARVAGPVVRDRLLASLLRIGSGDEWAELTALAILTPRLAWVTHRWAAAGVAGADLADAEAELVAECWAEIRASAGSSPPDAPGLALVDRPWARVRNRRATLRRRASHLVPGPPIEPEGYDDGRTGADLLAAAIGQAHRQGRLAAGPARALFLTRVVGLSAAEAARQLGTIPGSVRAWRSRAAGHLHLDEARRTTRTAA